MVFARTGLLGGKFKAHRVTIIRGLRYKFNVLQCVCKVHYLIYKDVISYAGSGTPTVSGLQGAQRLHPHPVTDDGNRC